MLAVGAVATVALSSGYGLSPGACLLPMIGGGPDVVDHDVTLSPRKLGDPQRALLQAPTFSQPPRSKHSRRALLQSAAASTLLPPPTFAATGNAVDLVATATQLSTEARALQFFVREEAPAARPSYDSVRRRVVSARKRLQQLLTAMAAAAPDLKICSPEEASCECTPDPTLMREASRQVDILVDQIAAIDAALACA